MNSKLKCNMCSAKIQGQFKFCGKCGFSLDMECTKCLIRADLSMEFCTNCGTKMKKSDFSADLEILETNNTSQRVESSIKHLQIWVNILQDGKEIKQEEGGGKRAIQLHENANYNYIKQKIIDQYFPSYYFILIL